MGLFCKYRVENRGSLKSHQQISLSFHSFPHDEGSIVTVEQLLGMSPGSFVEKMKQKSHTAGHLG